MILGLSDQELKLIIKESKSHTEVIVCANKRVSGGYMKTLKKWMIENNINIDHFQSVKPSKRKPLQDILVCPSNYSSSTLRSRLIKAGILEKRCAVCKLTHWGGCELPLELHHKNGKPFDNRIENIEIRCKNCHSDSDNYRNKRGTDDKS